LQFNTEWTLTVRYDEGVNTELQRIINTPTENMSQHLNFDAFR